MERFWLITFFMVLGIVLGGLVTWRLFGKHRNLVKLFAWMGDNCNADEKAALNRLLISPGNHRPEDIRMIALVIQRAPDEIKQLLRQAARDVSRLEGEG
jgi:hypothetical protein